MRESIFGLLMLVSLLGWAWATSGCVARVGLRTVVYLQRGIALTIVHECSDQALVYQGQKVVARVNGSAPVEIPLGPRILGDQEVQVTVQSLDASGQVVDTFVESFYIDQYSTRARVWYIGPKYTQADRNSRCRQ